VRLVLAITMTAVVAVASDPVKDAFGKKFAIVLREGLAVGICNARNLSGPGGRIGLGQTAPLAVSIDGERAEYKAAQTGFGAVLSGCDAIVPERLSKGEVVRIRGIHNSGGTVHLFVQNAAIHSVERGIGAMVHQSGETGEADLRFKVGESESAVGIISHWLRPFESEDDARSFANTASGMRVKQVSSGMTFAEVEASLGIPETRADLGEKVLYKYKNMTVEFVNGKVVDIH
jgi:hypothetical protein